MSVIVTYAPTEPSDADVNDVYYNQLVSVIQSVPTHDILAILGDFNAAAGPPSDMSRAFGHYSSGSLNDNSERLRSLCDMHDLTILGTWFRRLDIRRMTWLSHDGFTKKEIDHILTRHRDKGQFQSCRVYRDAEAPANTDHMLLGTELYISLQKLKKSQTTPKQLNVASLINDPALQAQYNITIQNKFTVLGPLSNDVDTAWNSFSSTVTEAAVETVGTRIHIRKPWLSATASTIIDQKAAARKRGDHAERNRLQRAFKTRAKEDHEAFITRTVEEVEEGIKSNHLGPAFKAIKVLTGNKPTQVMSFVNKVDGSPCTSLEETLHRWHEHFTAAHLITHRVLRVPIWTRKRTPLRGTLIPQ